MCVCECILTCKLSILKEIIWMRDLKSESKICWRIVLQVVGKMLVRRLNVVRMSVSAPWSTLTPLALSKFKYFKCLPTHTVTPPAYETHVYMCMWKYCFPKAAKPNRTKPKQCVWIIFGLCECSMSQSKCHAKPNQNSLCE